MADKTDDELVAAGMAVVRPMLEDSQRYWRWHEQESAEREPWQGSIGAWAGWRAGKADLAQQVMKIMERSFVGRRIDGALFDEDLLARLYGLLRQHGAGPTAEQESE